MAEIKLEKVSHMGAVRKGEVRKECTRRPRYYNEGRDWYFRTREGAAVGPFNRLSEAVAWAADYVDYVQSAPSFEEVIQARFVA